MHDDHTSRRFPWLRIAFGGISILVLIGSFGGFMWLLRTYVDPPRIAAPLPPPSAAALLASVSNTARTEPSEPHVIMAARVEPQMSPSGQNGPASGLPRERYERAPPPPHSGAPIPSWADSPLPGAPPSFSVAGSPSVASSSPLAASRPPASAEPGTISLDGPVPLPRPKPRVVVRVQLPAAAPLPRPRPPA